jgi:hypothetical protein
MHAVPHSVRQCQVGVVLGHESEKHNHDKMTSHDESYFLRSTVEKIKIIIS